MHIWMSLFGGSPFTMTLLSHKVLSRPICKKLLTHKLLHKTAQERDEEAQCEYWDIICDHSAGWGKEFVFVDEMSKNDHNTAWQYGLAIAGDHADFIDNFVHGDRYSMVAGITTDGYVSTCVIPGSFNAQEFFDYITEQVVGSKAISYIFVSDIFPQWLPEMNLYPGNWSILIADNCQIHHNIQLVVIVNAAGESCQCNWSYWSILV